MKRYGNLYQQICSLKNVRAGHENARRGKRHYPAVARIDADLDRHVEALRETLCSETFVNSPYETFIKRGRKERLVFKLPYWPDRVLHHCVVQVLEPIWSRTYVRDTYASMKGRGILDGAKRVRAMLKDVPGTAYCLKMDVVKFYPSIDHDVMRNILQRKIKCRPTLRLLDTILRSSSPGVPIGNYLSQHFGNLCLAYFDHWMKEAQGVRHYSRYCDDIIVLGADKSRLHELRKLSEEYMAEQLKLRIKPNWRVFPVDANGLDFLGYVFRHDHVRLRKSIAQDFKSTVVRIKKRYLSMPLAKIMNSLMSYYGWMSHANAWNLWRTHVDAELLQIVAGVCKINGMTIPKPLWRS